ncbi:MAG: dihydroneopterin aldolase [Bacteroidaceae bacterium]|nr:dihydroneopterin aldolase [Bacteroidaceae bacterium]
MKITDYNIELRDIHLYAHHGVMEQEYNVGAWFTVDIKLSIGKQECIATDNIDETVNYALLYNIVKEQMQQPSKLLEHVCGRILECIFRECPIVDRAQVTLCKDTPPLGGDRMQAAVTLKAER